VAGDGVAQGFTLRRPRRDVHRSEALAWLAQNASSDQMGVITSLPDFSELRELEFEAWQTWFVAAAETVMRWVSPNAVAIFFQTDVVRQGAWIDKSHLVLRAAEVAGARLLWHKIVCRKPPGTLTHGRAGYSHLLCFSRGRLAAKKSSIADVVADAGFKPTEKSMGAVACRLACRFLLDETGARVVVDPFCGLGTALAVANSLGMDAVGVDRSARCCSAARRLVLPRELA
jgi:hypothetical protein